MINIETVVLNTVTDGNAHLWSREFKIPTNNSFDRVTGISIKPYLSNDAYATVKEDDNAFLFKLGDRSNSEIIKQATTGTTIVSKEVPPEGRFYPIDIDSRNNELRLILKGMNITSPYDNHALSLLVTLRYEKD